MVDLKTIGYRRPPATASSATVLACNMLQDLMEWYVKEEDEEDEEESVEDEERYLSPAEAAASYLYVARMARGELIIPQDGSPITDRQLASLLARAFEYRLHVVEDKFRDYQAERALLQSVS